MAEREQRREEIQRFIVENVREHPQDIAALVAAHFEISRQAAVRHLRRLQTEGMISAQGKTRDRRYELLPVKTASFNYPIEPGTTEDKVWRQDVGPLVTGIRDNVRQICQYGFTEMFNNALEHSEGQGIVVTVDLGPDRIEISVTDNGVGIFNKIQRELGLDDPLHAVLELSKGKLTTDPRGHSGEGIFFVSRTFDLFVIASYCLLWSHTPKDFDIAYEDESVLEGTAVTLRISLNSSRTAKSVFDQFSTEDFAFDRTLVPVFLAQYGQDSLVSRSQARRLLARFDRFKEVILDFAKVDFIGQAFADEIFRVYRREHPEIALTTAHASPDVAGMIRRVQNADTGGQS